MASDPQLKSGWLLMTIPKALKTYLKMIEKVHERYHVIHWEEFCLEVEQYAAKIDAMLVTSYHMPKLSPKLLDRMTKLKSVVTVTAGTDHLDLALLQKYNVRVCTGAGTNSDACADMAFNLLLSAARRNSEVVDLAHRFAARSETVMEETFHFLGHEVTGSTLGIIGMGGIGYEVARRAIGFKMKTLYYNRNRRSKADEDEVKAGYCPSLDNLLPQVDYLVLSLPLTEATRHIIGKDQLQRMKPNAIIINVARGELIDHDDLTDALRSRTIAGAALDVTEPEPLPPNHPLLTMTNVIITPHCSAFTKDCGKRIFQRIMDNLSTSLATT
ncbi:glyoxylate/hydroxypyruvate reductase B-like [Lytechinus pictus]|uniref:glyoxylate/hydroxypyruvate reductase B-like n=1 Tax=Lytechinus pictus TaxID=7653 RepID=UPI0030BA2200